MERDALLSQKSPVRFGAHVVAGPLLGRGGMGEVYFGWHDGLDRAVAVKTNRSPRGLGGVRFRREAELGSRIRSDHLVAVIEYELGTQRPYIVMEYVFGMSVGAFLAALHWAPLDAEWGVAIVASAARGVAAMHAHDCIHRDVKPDNILIPAVDGTTLQLNGCKLVDLGLAKQTGQAPEPLLGTPKDVGLGTVGFAPKEQWLNARDAHPAADVFGLAAVLYSLLTGGVPYYAGSGGPLMEFLSRLVQATPPPPLSETRPEISRELSDLVQACLADEPENRPADAQVLLDRLTRVPEHSREPTLCKIPAVPVSGEWEIDEAMSTSSYLRRRWKAADGSPRSTVADIRLG